MVREVFGKGNEFATKITYRTRDGKPDDLLQAFRNSMNPRIVVTVDMIATGTDVKPLECLLFMRGVKSRTYFEQMLGRGVRVIDETDFQAVTDDAKSKDRFIVVDAVGITDTPLIETVQPLERKPRRSLRTCSSWSRSAAETRRSPPRSQAGWPGSTSASPKTTGTRSQSWRAEST